MDTQHAIEARWGCRKYLDTPVSNDVLAIILDAARLAPSAGNLQDRSFIVVRNQETRNALAEASGSQLWMGSAPLHVVVLSENLKLGKFFGPRGEKIYSVQDTSFSVENALLAATNAGLACSLIVGFNEEKVMQILKIPAPAQPHAIITLGYPAEETKPSNKYALERFVFFEAYGEKTVSLGDSLGQVRETVKASVAAPVQAAKEHGSDILDKVKSLFTKKKKGPQPVDHFMQAQAVPAFDMGDETDDIPRQLPRG